MVKIKKKDQVIVIAGKDKGKKGEVLKVLYKTDKFSGRKLAVKALVEGINLFVKHKKPEPNKNSPGEIIRKEMPIAISNVALVDPKTNKASKVGFKFIDLNESASSLESTERKGKKKVRYFKSSQEVVDV
jgi:large subunit ribosomal protein L24